MDTKQVERCACCGSPYKEGDEWTDDEYCGNCWGCRAKVEADLDEA